MDRDREGDGVVVLNELLLEQEVLMVQNELAVAVLHNDPERLHPPVHLLLFDKKIEVSLEFAEPQSLVQPFKREKPLAVFCASPAFKEGKGSLLGL